ncbi:M13 family metallopeptidase [Mycoplasma nasistruthionis]|uniref:M13 family metallopeptidase n=1 Tax=Mycoplasma nasistruthionis TaxID=353852 RepID=A0A4Y6I6N1_9MOLU|nr:M13 family metallopeptidase [Mycoplasma nasistruthionis]QCZ36748.1 M13 family metallopeptidase [Mycoplasma nasistruthionis]QDF65031.1 M13 family metallopeptidase [Mycoplasma nasistruthionis]
MQKPRLQDDFYDFVNYDWLQETKIPEDRSSMSAFGELDLKLEKLLKGLTHDWATNQKDIPNNAHIQNYVKFYQMILDNDTRENQGWEPARKYLADLENLKDFHQLNANYKHFAFKYSFMPLDFGVDEDFINNKIKVMWLGEPSLILPNKDTYADKEQKDKLLSAWKNMVHDLLVDYGKTKQEANQLIKDAIEFDSLLVPVVLSSVQKADYVSLYNMKEISWYNNKSHFFKIHTLANRLVGQNVESISCVNPEFINKLDQIFTKSNFKKYKALFFIKNLIFAAKYLDETKRIKSVEYANAVYSIDKPRELELYAYDTAEKYFSMPLGLYYANEYFGAQAKADVEKMVSNMINIYKTRLENNTWLSQATKDMAIKKLNKLGVMIGYPEEIRPFYDKFITQGYDENSSVLENVVKFNQIKEEYAFSLYLKETNPNLWGMSPATINAYFNPFANHIVFPAAILQAPYYDINQSSSANYGGIGAVIAHEISHAFDNNGAQFDENGSLNNWWTEQDKEKFAEKTQAVIELYNSRITPYGPVNGKLTVSENIADIGGVSCALEAASLEQDFDAKAFFENWARVWRKVEKEGLARRLLESDVHAPAKERGNVLMMNNDLFHETYEIQESDQMYLAKDKRIKIW